MRLFCLLLLLPGSAFFPSPLRGQSPPPETEQFAYPAPGKLIDIGGYKLHLYCTGSGKTTVVFISGAMGFSFDWAVLQEKLSAQTKVCSYDRPGLAFSDPGPLPHTIAQDVYELHQLLKTGHVKPPFILVGQSIGGLIARTYAKEYPSEVTGMVLVDATSENGLFGVHGKIERMRLLASPDKKVPPIRDHFDPRIDTFTTHASAPLRIDPKWDSIQKIRQWAISLPKYASAGSGEYWPEEFALIYADSLAYRIGNRPLLVLCSIRNDYPPGWDMRDSMMNDKIRNQRHFLSFSTNSKFITTVNSGHEIQATEPDLVIDAIKQVIYSVTHKSRL